MADSKELASQLKIQQDINKALQARQAMLDANTKNLTGQAKIAAELCAALECQNLEGMSDRLDEINTGLQESATRAREASEEMGGMSEATEETEGRAKSLTESFHDMVEELGAAGAAMVGFASGAAKGFKSGIADVQMFAAGIQSAIGGILSLGKSMLAIPLNIMSGLGEMSAEAAGSGGGGASALAQAMEEVRGEFGSFATGEGRAVMDGFDTLTSSGSALADTGLSITQVFGDAGAALQAVAELAKSAGADFHMLKDSLAENADMLLMMNKGLGMTNDALVEVTKKAQLAGKDVGSELLSITSMTISMEKQFGVSGKTIGKNFSELAKDVKTFGSLSNKELIATATYMAKLGLEAKDLQGIVGKTDDFESAAEAVSQLNQAFGVQLDTMELMNADPAEKVEMLRKSFEEAGKSIEDMTRQEKALLAEQTGMEVSALEGALAQENMGTSLEDIEAGADAAEAQTMNQAEAMNHLADSIERVLGGGGGADKAFKSLFDALITGFMDGFTSGEKFGQLLENIQEVFQVVAEFGNELGQMMYQLVDDLGLFDALFDIFNVDDIKKLLGIGGGGGLLGIFGKFKDALTGKGQYSPQQMAEDIGKEFKKWFDTKGPAFTKLKEAFIKGIEMIGGIIEGLIPWVVEKISDMITGLADFIRDPSALQAAGEQGIGGAIMGALMNAGQALISAAPMLLDALLDLLSAVFEQHGGKIIAVGAALAGYVFLKMMVMGAISAAKAALFQVVVQKLAALMGGAVEGAGPVASQGKAAGSFGKSLKSGFTGMAEGLKGFIQKVAEVKPGDILKAMVNLGLIALSFLPAMVIFALGLVAVAVVIGLVPFTSVMAGIIALALAIPVVNMMLVMAQGIQPGMVPTAMLGLIMGALLLTVGGVVFALALGLIGAVVGMVGVGTIAMSIVGLAALAVGAVAVALSIVPFALLGALAGLALLASFGMVVGAAMLTVGGVAFTLALGIIGNTVLGVGMGTIMAAGMGMIVLAIAAMAVAAAAVAFTVGIPFFVVGSLGAILAAVFLVATVPFMLAAGIFGEFVMGMPLAKIAGAMLTLIILSGAAWATAAILGYAGPAFLIGAIGALAAAVFFLAAGLVMMPALTIMQDAMPADMTVAMTGMVMMVPLMGAAAITAAIMSYGLPYFAIGAVAALVATLFFMALGVMLPELNNAMDSMPGDMTTASVNMGLLAILMGFSFVTAMIASYGIPWFLIGSVGVLAAIPFFMALQEMLPGVEEFAGAINIGTMTKAAAMMGMLGMIFFTTAAMAVVALLMTVFLNPIIMWLAKKGLGIVGELLSSVTENLAPGLKALDQLKISDPAGLEAKVGALGGIFDAMSGLGDIIVKIAALQVLNSATGGEGDLLASASVFLDSMLKGAQKLIVVLVRMVKNMPEGDIKKLEAIAGVLAAIATLMQALQPPPGLFETMTEMSSGGFFGGGQDVDVEGILAAYAEQAQAMMNAMRESVVGMLQEILAIDIGDDPEAAKTKAEVIATIIGAVVEMSTGFGEMAAGVMEMNNEQQDLWGSGPSVEETLASYMNVITMIMGAIQAQLPVIVGSILGIEIPNPEAAKPKLEVISMAMSALSDFASAIGTFQGMIPQDSGSWWPFGEDTDPLEEFMGTVSAIVSVALAWIPTIVTSLLSIAIPSGDEAKSKLEIISMSMSTLADFAGVMSTMQDSFGSGAADIYNSLGGTLQGLAWIMGYNSDGTGKTLPELMVVISEMQLPDAGTITANIETLKAALDAVGSLGESLSNLQSSFEGLAGDGEGLGVATVIEAAIAEVQALQDAFSTMGEIDLQAGLDNFAAAVGTSTSALTIENSPLNITINLQVTMDANKLGKVLVDKSVMSSPLATADNA